MSIRNYNAFLRAVRKKHGITQSQAQSSYRRLKERLGRSPKGVDVSRHPIITNRAVKGRASAKKAGRGRRKTGAHGARKGKISVKSIAQWRRLYKENGPFEEQDTIVSSADYGSKKGRR